MVELVKWSKSLKDQGHEVEMEKFNLNSQFWVAAKSQKSVIEKQSYFLLRGPVGHTPHPNHQPIQTQVELSIHFNQSPNGLRDRDNLTPYNPR